MILKRNKGYVAWALRRWDPDHPMRADEAEVYLATQSCCMLVTGIIGTIAAIGLSVALIHAAEAHFSVPNNERIAILVAGSTAFLFGTTCFRFLRAIVALPGHFERCGMADRPEQKPSEKTLSEAMGTDSVSA